MYSIIVHPTDLSETTVPALKTAYDLARNLNSRLIICYVAHPPMVASGTRLTDPKSGQSRDIDEEIRSLQPLEPAVDCSNSQPSTICRSRILGAVNDVGRT